jgi:hypothetical protein
VKSAEVEERGYEEEDDIDTGETNVDPVDPRVSYSSAAIFSEPDAEEPDKLE